MTRRRPSRQFTEHRHHLTRPVVAAASLATLLAFTGARSALATVCDASSFSCPPTGTCIINGTWDIGDGCSLDFGTQPIEVRGTLQAATTSGSFLINAGAVVLKSGKLKSLGTLFEPGGNITIRSSGILSMEGSGPRIDTSGTGGGGAIEVTAATISIATGLIVSEGGTGVACGDAGDITLRATTGLVTVSSTVRANTSGSDCDGGSIHLSGTSVNINGDIDARGGSSASDEAIVVDAQSGDLVIANGASLRADGTGQPDGQGASGGRIALLCGGNVTINGAISATGNAPDAVAGGVSIAASGNATIAGPINLSGSGTGAGGDLTVVAGGTLQTGGEIRATGGAIYPGGRGGTVQLRAAGSLSVSSDILTSAADGGGVVLVGNPIATFGSITAKGARGTGGRVVIESCNASILGTIDTGATLGGVSGSTSISAGSISIQAAASILGQPCGANGACLNLRTLTGHLTVSNQAVLSPPPVIATDDTLPSC